MDTNISITSVAHGGYGVCRIEGQVCFVPYGLPGDIVRLRVVRQARNVLWGEIVEVVEPSPDRIAACCPKFGACGGCVWMHFAYPAQAEWKRRIVYDCLTRIGGVEADIAWQEDPALRLGYRTRAEFHAEGGKVGFYALGSRTVVDIERCGLCHNRLNGALDTLRALPIRTAVEVTVNPEGPDVLVWTKTPERAIREAFPSANSREDKKPFQFLFDGAPIVNGAFSQSSLLLNRMLVRTVHAWVGNAASVLDLYCGNGNLTLALAARARVIGMDHHRAAIHAANELAPGAYRVGDETAFRQALQQPWDLVLLDPPRTGAKAIVEALAKDPAAAIVYVSCDPATLARDLRVLAAHGWQLKSVTVVDIFPHTPHVETICRLER